MIKVFNSRFENSLRMLLLLNCFSEAKDLESLYILDFLAIYGRDFEITTNNLNGDNDFKFSEFQSRKGICRKALKELVLKGLVTPIKSIDGILYQVTDAGKEYAGELKSEYAIEYKDNAQKVIQYSGNYSNRQIMAMINKLSTENIRGESSE